MHKETGILANEDFYFILKLTLIVHIYRKSNISIHV
jgi:hypothetical protein